MDFFYDGQIRRYVTQFMRVFIGFKYKSGDGTLKEVPVLYGDMTRQVASIIKDNSENKLPTVPKISCYISGLDIDTTRLADPTFVSKVNIRERRWTDNTGSIEYQNVQGGNYTVERLMPTPYKLTMKCDIWTSNTDQKLQLLEQILVLFNPSLEIQTTDNYIDWTSLTVLDLKTTNFTSRTIPAGAESEIDICTLDFEMPIYITPPAKVKKLGIVKSVISNVFMDSGDIVTLEDLVFNRVKGAFSTTTNRYRVLLFKSNTGVWNDGQYDLTLVNPSAAVLALGLDQKDFKNGEPWDWMKALDVQGGYEANSGIYFKLPDDTEVRGTYVINPIDPSILTVSIDTDTMHDNTPIAPIDQLLRRLSGDSAGTIDAIIDPYKYNPVEVYGNQTNIPVGLRFLMLDDVNSSVNTGQTYGQTPNNHLYDGPDGWKDLDSHGNYNNDPTIKANSIIEWNGTNWVTVWDPATGEANTYFQNLRTGIQYRWDGDQWLKAFEGEYAPGYWNFIPPEL